MLSVRGSIVRGNSVVAPHSLLPDYLAFTAAASAAAATAASAAGVAVAAAAAPTGYGALVVCGTRGLGVLQVGASGGREGGRT